MGRARRFICGCCPPTEARFGLAGEWPDRCGSCQSPWKLVDPLDRVVEGSTVRDVTITPDDAVQMLSMARSVEGDNDPTKVDIYVRLMREGRWTDMTLGLGGDGCPIVFDGDGRLRYGMQRLEACARAGVTIRAVVAEWPRKELG